MANANHQEPSVPRDHRAVIVAIVGLLVIVAIVITAFVALPGPVAERMVDNKSESMVAIASASLTAVGTVVSAYFGIRAANIAREDNNKAGQRHEVRATELAAVSPDEVAAANKRATDRIRELGI